METVSVIVPVMNEQETIGPLIEKIVDVFSSSIDASTILNEIIFIDDGSTDDTWRKIAGAASIEGSVVHGIRFRRNLGKAAALQEGIGRANGDIIITMDGDLQDDPKEIPRFIEAIHSGIDVVSGWKRTRYDPLGKTLPSKLFNYVTARISGVSIHDFNCGFKAYRREVFCAVNLYGELHRFIPALADAVGYKVGEIEVQHHPRVYGKSKYGIGRLLKGFLDLLTVVTITKFNSRPGHLFGGLGVAVGAVGLAINAYLLLVWLGGEAIGHRPLLSLGILLSILSLQFILFGMMAELLISLKRSAPKGIVAEVATFSETAAPTSEKSSLSTLS